MNRFIILLIFSQLINVIHILKVLMFYYLVGNVIYYVFDKWISANKAFATENLDCF